MSKEDRQLAADLRRDFGDEDELRASLRSFGWHPRFPALEDEHGSILVGNRRLALARELGITPVIEKISLGSGDEADAERLKLALISNVGRKQLSQRDRKRVAEHLDKRGWTQERIAAALGVSQRTISSDLAGLEVTSKPPRPKGGRPKGSSKPKPVVDRQRKIIDLADVGMPKQDIANAVGVGTRMVDRVLEVEKARREVPEPTVDQAALPMSAQEKLAAAIRQHKRQLDAEYQARMSEEIRKHFDEYVLPEYRKRAAEADRIVSGRKSHLSRALFRSILSCLHPDRVTDEQLKKRYAEAFHAFNGLELLLCGEKEMPTKPTNLPRTYAEMMARKAAVQAQRRRKTNGGVARR